MSTSSTLGFARSSKLAPEIRLFWGVLLRAVLDLQSPNGVSARAHDWIFIDNDGFLAVCEMVGTDPARFRAKVKRALASGRDFTKVHESMALRSGFEARADRDEERLLRQYS